MARAAGTPADGGTSGKDASLDVELANEQSSQPTAAPGMPVTFQHVTYRVLSSRKRNFWVTLLEDVTAYLAPGALTAILGPSGSGKSTLLDLLLLRKTVGQLGAEARILYGGRRASASFLRRHVGYVEQFDTLLPALTVFDMLLYTAQLKLPRELPLANKVDQVEEIIQKLNLEDCQDTVIGSVMSRGVSGGEAKRTNIGIALISHPTFLFCDEPTSGLDSFNAHSVVQVVKDLALDGITICSTIHSPPPYTFELFDRLIVLEKGRVAYFGENGPAVLRYFHSTFPQLRPLKPMEGIADFVVDVTSQAAKEEKRRAPGQHRGQQWGLRRRRRQQQQQQQQQQEPGGGGGGAAGEGGNGMEPLRFADRYQESRLRVECEQQIQEYIDAAVKAQPEPQFSFRASWRRLGSSVSNNAAGDGTLPMLGGLQATVTPFWWALLTLWRYRSSANFRRMDYLAPRIFEHVVTVFIIVTLYLNVGEDVEAAEVVTVGAILFMWSVLCAYGSMGLLPLLILERPVFIRERADGLYRPITYLVFKFSEEVFAASLASVPYALLVFYLVGLQGSFLLFWVVYLLTMAIAIALALLMGALCSSVDVAGATLPTYTGTLLYFSGFLIPWDQIPNYWKWYAYIDYLRYSWGALMINQFEGSRNIVSVDGQRVLDYYGLEGVNKWGWVGFEAVFLAVFLAFTWAALAGIKHQKR